jgi:hypothetical protein
MAAVAGAVVHAAGMAYPWRETEVAWYFEPEAKDWKPMPPMPEGRAYTQGTAALDSLVVVGGRKNFHGCKEAFQLQRVSQRDWRWEVLPSLSQGRAAAAVAAVDSLVVAVGGGDWDRKRGGAFLPREVTQVEGLDLKQKDKGWRQLAAFPAGSRVGAMAASVQGKIYVFGGYDHWYENEERHFKHYADAYCYDPSADRWESLPGLPGTVSNAGVATWQERYVVLAGGLMEVPGGNGLTYKSVMVDPQRKVVIGEYSDRVLLYDTTNRTCIWAEGQMPRGTNDLRLCTLGERLYALGGENVDVTLSNTSNDFLVGEWKG